MSTGKQQTVVFLATGAWIGYAPVAPGTFGSLAALPLCFLLAGVPLATRMIVLLALLAASTWIAHAAERIMGRSDPKQVVIDEIGGMAVALWALPFTPVHVISGFALFRLFDILKPLPIRWIERKAPGGWGIMLDDITAGIFANVLLRLIV